MSKEVAMKTNDNKIMSTRFTNSVSGYFENAVGTRIELTERQKQLSNHLFIKITEVLNSLEQKRQENGGKGTPYTWQNVNMDGLSMAAYSTVRLGVDSFVDDHVYIIPFFNSTKKKYDLDIRLGYKGILHYKKQYAEKPITDIRIELVYEKDQFEVKKANGDSRKDTYTFSVGSPFDRGKIVGGFGYIETEDTAQIHLMSLKDLNKRKDRSKGNAFWGPWEEEMYYKTLVHYVAKQIRMDPDKISEYSVELHEVSKPVQKEVINVEAEISASLEETIEEQEPQVMTLDEPREPLEFKDVEPEQVPLQTQMDSSVAPF